MTHPLKFLWLPLLLAVCWSACGDAATGNSVYTERDGKVIYTGEKGNQVVVQLLSEPASLHPTNGRGGSRTIVQSYLNQQLLRIDITTGKLIPELAAALPVVSEDLLSYTFEVDPDAHWDDGKAITAQDVLFSIKVNSCPLTENYDVKSYLDFLESVTLDAGNERKLTLRMTKKYIHNPYFMTNLYIIDPRFFDPESVLEKFSLDQLRAEKSAEEPALKAWAAEFNDAKYAREVEMIKGTSGPYTLTQWLPDQQLILSRKENYWGEGKASVVHSNYPDQLVFRFLRDQNAIELEILQEQIDVSFQLSTLSFENLRQNPAIAENYHLIKKEKDGINLIFLNNRPDGSNHPAIFSDKAVRKAVAHLTPVDQIIEQFFQGHAVRTSSPIPPLSEDYHQGLPLIPFDVDRATQLLTDAGWVDADQDQIRDKVVDGQRIPLRFQLTYPAGQQVVDEVIKLIQSEMRSAGIDCVPDPVNMQILQSKLTQNDYDAVFIALGTAPVPYDFKQLWYSAEWPGSNWSGFANERADELVDSSRVEMNVANRKRMIDELQEIIFEEQPCVFLFSPTNKVAIHRRFNHADVYPVRYYVNLNNLWMIKE